MHMAACHEQAQAQTLVVQTLYPTHSRGVLTVVSSVLLVQHEDASKVQAVATQVRA